MPRKSHLISLFCVIAFSSIAVFAADSQKKLEETLTKFYDAYSQSKWKTASQYVDPESRESFLAQTKSTILKYKISKIEMQKDAQEATASVAVDMPVATLGGTVMTLSAQTQWKWQKGKWLMKMSGPPPYAVAMAAGVKGALPPAHDNPTPDLKFDYREFDFGTKRQGDLVQVEFPFQNVSDHPIQVTASLVSECKCLEVGVNKETVAPGEKAAVTFTLHSDPFTFYYHQGIGVRVQPGNGTAILDIVGFLAPISENPLPPDVSSNKAK